MSKCSACKDEIGEVHGAPYLHFKDIRLCSGCYINMITPIFELRGAGDGGLIDIIFQECVRLDFNLKRKKKTIPVSKLGERIARYFPNEESQQNA